VCVHVCARAWGGLGMLIESDDLAWQSEEQVSHVFSDKTGTLTEKEMVLARVCLPFGSDLGDFREVSFASAAAPAPAAAQGQQLGGGGPWAEALGEGVADLRRSFLVEVEKLQALVDRAPGREARQDLAPQGGSSTRPLAPICEQGDEDTPQAPAPLESAEAPLDKESPEWLGLNASTVWGSEGMSSRGGGGERVSTFAELSAEIGSDQGTRHVMPSPSIKSGAMKGFRSSPSGTSGVTTILYGDDRRAQQKAKDLSLDEVLRGIYFAVFRRHPRPPWEQGPEPGSGHLDELSAHRHRDSVQDDTHDDGNSFALLRHQPLLCHLFTLELLLRMKAYGLRELFIAHGVSWAWLDLFIVASALLEMVFDLLFLAGSVSSDKPSGLRLRHFANINYGNFVGSATGFPSKLGGDTQE